jgi:hypothetical protein
MQLRIQTLQISLVRVPMLDPDRRRRRRPKPDARPKGKPVKGRNPNQSAPTRAALSRP